MRALPTFPTAEALGTDPHAIADFNILYRGADLDSFADDFMAHGEWIGL